MMLLREATATTHDAAHDSTGESGELSQPALHNAPGKALTMDEHHMNEDMKRCIRLCQDCHTLCIQTIGHCVKVGGRYAAPDHIRLLEDCAQMCATTSD